MKRIPLILVLFVLVTLLAQAHEFWLQPTVFFVEPGQSVTVEVQVGEHFNGERSEGKKNRLIQYTHWNAATKEDLSPALTEGHYGVVSLTLAKQGTHLLAFANTNKYLEMRADSFLLYLQEDGLNQVIQLRKQLHQEKARSREFYRRCVKTLIQAGAYDATDQTVGLDTGMPLEIVPMQNPYGKKTGEWAQFRVLFERKPLANALVRYWNRPVGGVKSTPDTKPADLTEEHQRTDAQGQVSFRLKSGQNMISLVQMVPYTSDKQADWQSYWGSLTFGCR